MREEWVATTAPCFSPQRATPKPETTMNDGRFSGTKRSEDWESVWRH